MLYAVVNLSSKVTTREAELMTGAAIHQLAHHVAPAWGLGQFRYGLYHDLQNFPQDAIRIMITDGADRLGSYGYHDVGPDGVPYARVFVEEILIMGGSIFDGPTSVSATLSHEMIESAVDPALDQWRQGPGGEWPLEICDPVQSQSYKINVDGCAVSVSNFLFPSFYVDGQTDRLDYLGRVSRPFSISQGGYTPLRMADGRITRFPPGVAVAGAKRHPAARSFRRGMR